MAETLNFTNSPELHSSKKNQRIPLVLIHGWGLNSAVWQPFIESLPDSFIDAFNIITIDLPGFGLNVDIEIQPYSLANICQCINQTIAQPAVYLGWSLGGLVVTEMTLRYPNKVLGLITVASSPRFLEKEAKQEEDNQGMWPGIKPQVLNAFYKQLQIDTKKTISAFLKIQAMGSPHIRQDIKKISQLVFQHKMANKDTLDQSLKLLEVSDYRKRLKDITQPFLRIYGGADSLVPKGVAEKVSTLAEKSDQHVIKQASHAPFISHTDDFKEILFEWLSAKSKGNVSKGRYNFTF
jgi:pimeloyl-[acyl-carrier protein] methyl ester esterase